MKNEFGLKGKYPDVITKEQLIIILHISKRKATWILDNGFIPCTNSKKKTSKYKIKLDDVIYYISDSKVHPEKYRTPDGIFSNNPNRVYNRYELPQTLPSIEFQAWLKREWANLPDMLSNTDVMKITDYSINAINRWLQSGKLRSVKIQGDIITSKEWLINFYCKDGYVIVGMNKKHIKLLQNFFESL